MIHLRQKDSISAKALEFIILTDMRSGSVRQATWSEIDFNKQLWIIPPKHFKTRVEFRVPLQPQAILLLKQLPRINDSDRIFPNGQGQPLSDMALNQLMRGMHERGEFKGEAVPHGFRATHRTWAAEQTDYPEEVRKLASGHAVGDAVKEAYQRTDLLEKRRNLMNDWADFLDLPSTKSTDSDGKEV